MDVEATPAYRSQEVESTKTMIDRVERALISSLSAGGRHRLRHGEMLSWMVKEKTIEPHVPVWDKTQRKDETFSSSDFQWDEAADEYRCPQGHALRSEWRQFKTPRSRITKDDTIIYRSSQSDCSKCVMKSRCCPNTPTRRIKRSIYEDARRCGPSSCDDMGLPTVTKRAQEGRDALRSPQAHPETRSVATARALWRTG